MAKEFVHVCKMIMEEATLEPPKKRSIEDDIIFDFIKKHKKDLEDLISSTDAVTESERLRKAEEENQRIIDHLVTLFPDLKEQISQLKVEYTNEGIPHEENYCEYVGRSESLDDLSSTYPKDFLWALEISLPSKSESGSACIFSWSCEVVQEWETWSNKIYFQKPEYHHAFEKIEADEFQKTPLTILQATEIGFAVMDFLFYIDIDSDKFLLPLIKSPIDWNIYCECVDKINTLYS